MGVRSKENANRRLQTCPIDFLGTTANHLQPTAKVLKCVLYYRTTNKTPYFFPFPKIFIKALFKTPPAFSISFFVNAELTQILILGLCSTISCSQFLFVRETRTPLCAHSSTTSWSNLSSSSRLDSVVIFDTAAVAPDPTTAVDPVVLGIGARLT